MSIVSSFVKKKYKKAKKAWDRSDLGKTGGNLVNTVTGGASSAGKALENVYRDSGKVDYAARFGYFTSNVGNQATQAIEKVKEEGGKLASGDFDLKKAVTGTVSGASETFKKSDAGKGVKKLAKITGYTGSDADKALQKTEKEVGNVGKQALDVVSNPGKAVLDLADKGGKYVKRQLGVKVPTGKDILAQGVVSVGKALQKKPTETKAGPGGAVSIGGGRGLGTGAVQGLKGGAGMDTSRARAKQNKRKLRIR